MIYWLTLYLFQLSVSLPNLNISNSELFSANSSNAFSFDLSRSWIQGLVYLYEMVKQSKCQHRLLSWHHREVADNIFDLFHSSLHIHFTKIYTTERVPPHEGYRQRFTLVVSGIVQPVSASEQDCVSLAVDSRGILVFVAPHLLAPAIGAFVEKKPSSQAISWGCAISFSSQLSAAITSRLI